MDVGALRWITVALAGFLHYFHVKIDGQRFWRKALSVVASLIAQCAAHGIFAGHHRPQWMHRHFDGEVSAINIQLLAGENGKLKSLPAGY